MKKPFCSLLFSYSSKNALRLPQFLLLTFRRGFRQDMPCLRREKPNAALPMTSLGCPIRCGFTQGTWVYLETYPPTSHGKQPCAPAMSPMPHLIWAQAARPRATELSKSETKLVDVGETMEEGDGPQVQRNQKHHYVLMRKKKSLWGGVM